MATGSKYKYHRTRPLTEPLPEPNEADQGLTRSSVTTNVTGLQIVWVGMDRDGDTGRVSHGSSLSPHQWDALHCFIGMEAGSDSCLAAARALPPEAGPVCGSPCVHLNGLCWKHAPG